VPHVDGIEGVKLLQRNYTATYIIIQTVFPHGMVDLRPGNSLGAGAVDYHRAGAGHRGA
jgi:hypothetical protein